MDETTATRPDSDRRRSSRTAIVVKAVTLTVFVAIAVTVGILVDLPELEEIQQAVTELGPIAVVAFIGAYGLITLTPAPKAVLSIAAGAVFGFWAAVPIVIVGAMIGATTAFFLGQLLGRSAVEHFIGPKVEKIDRLLSRRGLVAVIGVRMVPVIPFTAINYASGLTGLRRRDYLLGTAIGMLPGIAAYVAIGAFGFELDWPFWLALGALGALTVGAALFAWRWNKHESGAEVD
ncbi:MAG: TVP38/TMEM64 family protein [Microcella sp.]